MLVTSNITASTACTKFGICAPDCSILPQNPSFLLPCFWLSSSELESCSSQGCNLSGWQQILILERGMLGYYADMTRPGLKTMYFQELLSNLLAWTSPQYHSKRSGCSPFNSHGFVLLTVGGYCLRGFSCCALIITISSCSFWALALVLDRFFGAAVHYWASKQQDIYNILQYLIWCILRYTLKNHFRSLVWAQILPHYATLNKPRLLLLQLQRLCRCLPLKIQSFLGFFQLTWGEQNHHSCINAWHGDHRLNRNLFGGHSVSNLRGANDTKSHTQIEAIKTQTIFYFITVYYIIMMQSMYSTVRFFKWQSGDHVGGNVLLIQKTTVGVCPPRHLGQAASALLQLFLDRHIWIRHLAAVRWGMLQAASDNRLLSIANICQPSMLGI